jgi:hypothetical protein
MIHVYNPNTQEAAVQEDGKFETSLDYMVRPCLKNKQTTNQKISNNNKIILAHPRKNLQL